MKILRVGDPHAKVSNLDEMKNLILFVIEMAKKHTVDRIEILGDLHHTHAVIRLEVQDFWTWALKELSEVCETVVLVGNHDISGNRSANYSALSVFTLMNWKNLKIIEKPTLSGVIAYVPYVHSADLFINSVTDLADKGAKVLVCHQTIQGSKYDNGMYAPDGIPTGEWSERFTHVISGHVHTEQEFGNIIYPGTGRWDSLADANKRKGIWVYNHNDVTGSITEREFISTAGVCSPIQILEWREGDPEPDEWPKNAKVAIELIGASQWVAQQKARFKGKCSVKTKITDTKKTNVRSAGKGLEDFFRNLFASTMDRENLIKHAREYGIL